MPPAMSPPRSTRRPATDRRKTTLFCPDCGHESGPEGDWIRRDDAFVCPCCDTVIDRRAAAE